VIYGLNILIKRKVQKAQCDKTKTKMKNKNSRRTYKTKKRKIKRLQWIIVLTLAIIGASIIIFFGQLLNHTPINNEIVRSDYWDEFYIINDILKDTPMADSARPCYISAKHFGVDPMLFVGIANAESSLGKHMPSNKYNAWGVRGNGETVKTYNSWEHSCNAWHLLIKNYYIDAGLDTSEKIMPKYVGWNNPNWIINVNKYYIVK